MIAKKLGKVAKMHNWGHSLREEPALNRFITDILPHKYVNKAAKNCVIPALLSVDYSSWGKAVDHIDFWCIVLPSKKGQSKRIFKKSKKIFKKKKKKKVG